MIVASCDDTSCPYCNFIQRLYQWLAHMWKLWKKSCQIGYKSQETLDGVCAFESRKLLYCSRLLRSVPALGRSTDVSYSILQTIPTPLWFYSALDLFPNSFSLSTWQLKMGSWCITASATRSLPPSPEHQQPLHWSLRVLLIHLADSADALPPHIWSQWCSQPFASALFLDVMR